MTNIKNPCPYCKKEITSTKLGNHIYSKHNALLFSRETTDGRKNIEKLHNPKRKAGDDLCFHISEADTHWFWCLGCKTVLERKVVIDKHYKDPECSAAHEACLAELRQKYPLVQPGVPVVGTGISPAQVENYQRIVYLLLQEIQNKDDQLFIEAKATYREQYKLWKRDPEHHKKPEDKPEKNKKPFTLTHHKLPKRLFKDLPFPLTDELLKEKFHEDEDDEFIESDCETEVPLTEEKVVEDRKEEDFVPDEFGAAVMGQLSLFMEPVVEEKPEVKPDPEPEVKPDPIILKDPEPEPIKTIPTVNKIPSCVIPFTSLSAFSTTVEPKKQYPTIVSSTKKPRPIQG